MITSACIIEHINSTKDVWDIINIIANIILVYTGGYIFLLTYFSKKVKLSSLQLKFEMFFGNTFSIILKNYTLQDFELQKIYIILKNGLSLEYDLEKENKEFILLLARKSIKIDIKYSNTDINFTYNDIDRIEAKTTSDKLICYRGKYKLVKYICNKFFHVYIKEKGVIPFFSYKYGNIVLSPCVKYVISLYNQDNTFDKNIFVTNKGFCDKYINIVKNGQLQYINAFPKEIVINLNKFQNYLKDEFFDKNQKWLVREVR